VVRADFPLDTRQDESASDSEAPSAEASFYAAIWRQSPHFRVGAPITRVELRFAANGLRFRTTTGEAIDLRAPAALLDRRNLALVWAGETERRR